MCTGLIVVDEKQFRFVRYNHVLLDSKYYESETRRWNCNITNAVVLNGVCVRFQLCVTHSSVMLLGSLSESMEKYDHLMLPQTFRKTFVFVALHGNHSCQSADMEAEESKSFFGSEIEVCTKMNKKYLTASWRIWKFKAWTECCFRCSVNVVQYWSILLLSCLKTSWTWNQYGALHALFHPLEKEAFHLWSMEWQYEGFI